jgi:hypothetical protein
MEGGKHDFASTNMPYSADEQGRPFSGEGDHVAQRMLCLFCRQCGTTLHVVAIPKRYKIPRKHPEPSGRAQQFQRPQPVSSSQAKISR